MIRKGDIKEALEKFLRAYDTLEPDFMNEDLWYAYEHGREILGDPVELFPGGYDYNDTHTHPYGWLPPNGCDICADAAKE